MQWLREKLGFGMQSAAQPVNAAVPSVATGAGTKKLLKVAGERPGCTMAGGKRLTRRRKSHKKTHRRSRK